MRGRILGLLIFTALFVGCAEKEFDPNDPAKSFGIAKEPFDDENWEIALTRLGEFKSRFPYSKFAAEAELLIADCHYNLGQYTEAALAYEQFVKLHPKHEKIDYALFRVGEAYWQDAPEDIDREQDYTIKAVDEWQKLAERMPASPYTQKAGDLIKKGKRRVAESIAFVTRFYCKQEIWHACAYRGIQLADEYGEFADLRVEAIQHAVEALGYVAKAKAADPASDKNLYFKTMSEAEIRARAANLQKALEDYKKSEGKG